MYAMWGGRGVASVTTGTGWGGVKIVKKRASQIPKECFAHVWSSSHTFLSSCSITILFVVFFFFFFNIGIVLFFILSLFLCCFFFLLLCVRCFRCQILTCVSFFFLM
eukprot:TRINITY_DN2780_c3_g1_i2.p1 TRINITY_DN2780_c3_g1~~TRINITY_DN2780_c3_g1_i2.p1  ORF type:complete len:107 (-),score=1.71 TRINITY_DN2780_c3_g1_i2:97-417(-)